MKRTPIACKIKLCDPEKVRLFWFQNKHGEDIKHTTISCKTYTSQTYGLVFSFKFNCCHFKLSPCLCLCLCSRVYCYVSQLYCNNFRIVFAQCTLYRAHRTHYATWWQSLQCSMGTLLLVFSIGYTCSHLYLFSSIQQQFNHWIDIPNYNQCWATEWWTRSRNCVACLQSFYNYELLTQARNCRIFNWIGISNL